MNYKNLIEQEEFGSMRFITCLTPDTFSKKIIVISTAINTAKGQTAISQVDAINFMNIEFSSIHWTVLKSHTTFEEAVAFHVEQVNNAKFRDCEEVEA